jgi:hypothetical protein
MTPSKKAEESERITEGKQEPSAHAMLAALKPLDRVKVKLVEPIHQENSTINQARMRYIVGGDDEAFDET